MEWTNRGDNAQPGSTPAGAGTSVPVTKHRGGKSNLVTKLFKFGAVALLLAVTALIVLVLIYAVRQSTNKGEAGAINKKQMQAVFLNGGQVYFGHITNLNDRYLQMADIYYLRVNQQVQPNQSTQTAANDISLVKLGCELHGPQDSMVVNQSQVIFWENLKDDGQVAKAVATYKQQNPNGQKCDTTSQTSTTPTSNTTTTPTTNTTTKKP